MLYMVPFEWFADPETAEKASTESTDFQYKICNPFLLTGLQVRQWPFSERYIHNFRILRSLFASFQNDFPWEDRYMQIEMGERAVAV